MRDDGQAITYGAINILLGRPGSDVERGIYCRHDDVAGDEGIDGFRCALLTGIDE